MNNNLNTKSIEPQRAKTIIYLLAGSVALMMTGFGIIMPVFARRLGEFGAGVEAMGVMTMAFALSQMIAAPWLGSLADRRGRRPLVLLALAAFALTNIGYLLANSTTAFIIVRFLGGALTAGLFPAAMGVVADIMPESERGRWVGMVMSGYAVGFVFGPALGGLLYDTWGFSAPFLVSAGLAVLGLSLATVLVPETLTRRSATPAHPTETTSIGQSLPRPLTIFGTLLVIDFVAVFAFAFIEPQMVFYFYDDLGWTTLQFGVVVGAYGLAMMLGQTLLGQLSDRFGRKPMMLIGLTLNITFYVTIAVTANFALMLVVAAVGGLGAALLNPALSAFYLDITAAQYRSRVIGIKEAVLGLGGVMGPLLVALVAGFTTAQGIFIIAGGLVLFTLVLAAVVLRQPASPAPAPAVVTAASNL